MTRPAPIIAGIVAALLLLFAVYMGSYYAMLNGRYNLLFQPDEPAYRIEGYIVWNTFYPAHQLDRLIRPDYWTPPPLLPSPPSPPSSGGLSGELPYAEVD